MRLDMGGNLWHHRNFARFWFSETISSFGSQFSGFALPVLAILSFNADPFQVAIIPTLAILPYPVLGLFVGVWVDRFRKRKIMIICNLGRMVSLASVPLASVLGVLSLNQIFVVALVNGIFSVFFDISYQAYLPILIERRDLIEGNQKLQVAASGASVAGPGLAGFIYQVIGGALTCAVDALGYLAASLALFDIKEEEQRKVPDLQGPQTRFFDEMREGVDVVLGNPLLRRIAGCTATSNFGAYMVGSVFTYFVLKYLQLSTVELGLIFTSGAIGFVVGALATNRVTARLGFGPGLAVSISIGGLAVLYPLATYGLTFVLPAMVAFVIGLSSPIYNISQISLRQAITPDRLQGRMNATIRVIVWGTIPVGSFVGGVLGGSIGVVDTMFLGGLIAGLAGIWIVSGPVMKLKKQPEPLAEEVLP